MAQVFTYIEKIRDKNDKIIGYKLRNVQTNEIITVSSGDLKDAIQRRQVEVTNLTLTADTRLIDKNSRQGNLEACKNVINESLILLHESFIKLSKTNPKFKFNRVPDGETTRYYIDITKLKNGVDYDISMTLVLIDFSKVMPLMGYDMLDVEIQCGGIEEGVNINVYEDDAKTIVSKIQASMNEVLKEVIK